MYATNSNQNEIPRTYPQEWGLSELERRAGALVKEALQAWPGAVKRVHWEDMKQTAMMSFLEHQDRPAAYGYAVASNALKEYKWVHIRALNGGWKSLVAQNYAVSDAELKEDWARPSRADRPHGYIRQAHRWEPVPRPVEWRVITRLDGDDAVSVEQIFRETLYILAGMSKSNWYPEQIYQGALVITMLTTDYTWEDVAQQTGLDGSEVTHIWWHYRRSRIKPFSQLSPLHQEIIRLRGQARLIYFEELSRHWLNYPKRKMVVLPQGIYTIIYKRRRRRRAHGYAEWYEAALQKGRMVNGRHTVRGVSLGRVGGITKERLLDAVQRLECKLSPSSDA